MIKEYKQYSKLLKFTFTGLTANGELYKRSNFMLTLIIHTIYNCHKYL